MRPGLTICTKGWQCVIKLVRVVFKSAEVHFVTILPPCFHLIVLYFVLLFSGL